MPLDDIDDPNFLELCALKALDWNIGIGLECWNEWIDCISKSHTAVTHHRVISWGYGVFTGIIERIKRKDPHWDCLCEGGATGSSVVNNSSTTGVEAIPWCPADDPIIPSTKPSRTMGMAPGTGKTTQPITAVKYSGLWR